MPAQNKQDWSAFYANVNNVALTQYPSLLHRWFPAGQVAGREFECGNLNGTPGKSFKVNIDTGKWADFAGNESGGDPISLYAAVHHLGQGEAGMQLGRELGLEPPRLRKAPESAWKPITPFPSGLVPAALPYGRPAGTVGPAWLYFDAEGQPLMYRVRFDQEGGHKEVWPLTWCQNAETGEKAWRWRDVPAPRPLFNLEKIAAKPDANVLIVEGEPCADAAEELLPDWLIVTWPGGSKRAGRKDTDWRPLAGRRVWIWPDNDDTGKSAALTIAEILAQANPMVVRPDPSWPEGHDIKDLQAAGWNTARVLEHIRRCSVPAGGDALKFTRLPVDLSSQDLDVQTQAVWTAVTTVNAPPSLFASYYGLTIVDRDLFGRARQRVADKGLLRNWLVSRMAFFTVGHGAQQRSTYPSEDLLTNLLVGRHPLKTLTRVAEVPVFTSDGRLIAREGFDEMSGVYYLPAPGLESLSPASAPTWTDAQAALMTFDDLLCDFPFQEDCDFAHALAFALVPVLRGTIRGPTPMFRFEAPSPGTGKSLLMRLLTNLTCMVVSDLSPTDDDEEWRKRITAALAQDPDAILIDNAERLESAQLKKVLTDEIWEDRQLGSNRTVRYPVRATFGVSLNNPLISRETIRRSLRIRLDARTEHPEARTGWRHKSLTEYAEQNRPELVSALLTVASYGLANGSTDDQPTLGSYEGFSRRLGAVLTALRVSGFLGDREDESMLSDAELSARAFVQAWGETYGEEAVSTENLIGVAEKIKDFYLGKGDSKRGMQTYLGTWLGKRRGVVFGEWKIANRINTRDGAFWKLSKII